MSGPKLQRQDELSGAVISVRVRFGVFELNLRERELRKFGLRVKLQQKPFQILHRLLETPGEFVSREELARVLWPELHVLFDRSLNTAVNALRRALGDPGRNPRFIESRQGLGYRFIAHVEHIQAEQAPGGARAQRRSTEAHRDYLKGRYFSDKQTRGGSTQERRPFRIGSCARSGLCAGLYRAGRYVYAVRVSGNASRRKSLLRMRRNSPRPRCESMTVWRRPTPRSPE